MQPDKGKEICSVISSDLKSKQSNIAANVNFEHKLSSSRQIKLMQKIHCNFVYTTN